MIGFQLISVNVIAMKNLLRAEASDFDSSAGSLRRAGGPNAGCLVHGLPGPEHSSIFMRRIYRPSL
jgi:hypothetical protein